MGELEIFSHRIKKLRQSLGMTQKEFCEHIGIKQQTLSGYERGIMKPPLDIAKEIAEKCNVSMDWLCGLSEKTRNDDIPQTYADVIDLFVKIENSLKSLHVGAQKITVNDNVMQCFLNDWGKILPLFRNGTIDNELYKLWVDNKKKEYGNVHIGNEDEIEEFLIVMDVVGSPILSRSKPPKPPQ